MKIWKGQLDGNITLSNIVYESPEILLEDRQEDFITIGFMALNNLAVTIDQKNSLIKFEDKSNLIQPAQVNV